MGSSAETLVDCSLPTVVTTYALLLSSASYRASSGDTDLLPHMLILFSQSRYYTIFCYADLKTAALRFDVPIHYYTLFGYADLKTATLHFDVTVHYCAIFGHADLKTTRLGFDVAVHYWRIFWSCGLENRELSQIGFESAFC